MGGSWCRKRHHEGLSVSACPSDDGSERLPIGIHPKLATPRWDEDQKEVHDARSLVARVCVGGRGAGGGWAHAVARHRSVPRFLFGCVVRRVCAVSTSRRAGLQPRVARPTWVWRSVLGGNGPNSPASGSSWDTSVHVESRIGTGSSASSKRPTTPACPATREGANEPCPCSVTSGPAVRSRQKSGRIRPISSPETAFSSLSGCACFFSFDGSESGASRQRRARPNACGRSERLPPSRDCRATGPDQVEHGPAGGSAHPPALRAPRALPPLTLDASGQPQLPGPTTT
jgi:hypothetical protein